MSSTSSDRAAREQRNTLLNADGTDLEIEARPETWVLIRLDTNVETALKARWLLNHF